ncbi:MAG: hypothetical protein IJA62_08010 [Ruminococcus sp.]|nr:hypothetical protein [Ruminococcus sp.]
MDTMQAEAMRRVREMHSPSSSQKEGSIPRTAPREAQGAPRQKEHTPPAPVPREESEAPIMQGNPLFADKEKFLILALIMILSSEEQSDPMLTLALLYLII